MTKLWPFQTENFFGLRNTGFLLEEWVIGRVRGRLLGWGTGTALEHHLSFTDTSF